MSVQESEADLDEFKNMISYDELYIKSKQINDELALEAAINSLDDAFQAMNTEQMKEEDFSNLPETIEQEKKRSYDLEGNYFILETPKIDQYR